MNGLEFIRLLRESLEGEMPPSVVRENVRYYEEYLAGETRAGKLERDVLAELGDPRLIAKTIIEANASSGEEGQQRYDQGRGTVYEDTPFDRTPYEERQDIHVHHFDLSKWYWKLAVIAVIAVVVVVAFTLLAGLVSLLLPLLLVLFVVALVKNLRR